MESAFLKNIIFMLLCFVIFEGKTRTSTIQFFKKRFWNNISKTDTTKNKKDELLLFITRNADTLVEQTQI